LARYLQLAGREEAQPPLVNTAALSSSSTASALGCDNSNNSNGNVDAHFDVEQLDLGNVDATRSVILEQSRMLAQLRSLIATILI
jgi:hypothetical protein